MKGAPLLVIIPVVTLLVTMAFFYFTRHVIKQKSTYFYIGAALILLFFVGIDFTPYKAMVQQHSVVSKFFYDLFKRGAMGTSILILVMLVGAMPTKSWFYRTYKPIRGEMAIIGGMFVLIHNFIYGRKYFVMMWNDISKVKDYELVAAILSIVALCILIPLWVTSFMTIRKRMKPQTWFKLHKLAYLYYFLVYAHVMVLYSNILHIALTTGKYERVNLLVFGMCFYTIIYGIYAIGKFCKWKHGKKEAIAE